MHKTNVKIVALIIITLSLSACVSSKNYFQLIEGSESGNVTSYPTNVYEVKISNTLSGHLWLHGGFEAPVILTIALNIPKEISLSLLNENITINSGTHKKLLKITGITTQSNTLVKANETITGNSKEQFTFFGYKSIPYEYLLKLENSTFEIASDAFSIQFPNMNINGEVITPPEFKFVKDKGLYLITIN